MAFVAWLSICFDVAGGTTRNIYLEAKLCVARVPHLMLGPNVLLVYLLLRAGVKVVFNDQMVFKIDMVHSITIVADSIL